MTSKKLAAAVGRRIRAARSRAELSQNDLHRMCGIPKEHLSRLENGHQAPSLPNLADLAKALGTSVADLLGVS